MPMHDIEHKILKAAQHGLPMSRTPYADLAGLVGIPVEPLLGILRQWQADGKIRRVGAVMNHFRMGHGCGAMVIWHVPEGDVDRAGRLFASFAKVSHVYRRPERKNWPYNLYTMVHAAKDDELEMIIVAMSQQSGITEFRKLKTVRELKKVPPTYIGQ